MKWWLTLSLLVATGWSQTVTITPINTFSTTWSQVDLAHAAAAATACNNANVGQGPTMEIPAPNTYCQHAGRNYAANGSAIWNGTGANPSGPLAFCLANVQGPLNVPTNGCFIVLDAGLFPAFTLTSVSAPTGAPLTAIYTGTIIGGASNAYAGMMFVVSGFSNFNNNGIFKAIASTATTLSLVNDVAVTETASATAAQEIQYGSPPASVPLFNYFASCTPNQYAFTNKCHGLNPPVIQTSANFSGNTPQYIYFISTQWNALPPAGTRINPAEPIQQNGTKAGDGYSAPLNLSPNITAATQMARITNTSDNNGEANAIFFSNGPAYYRFDGIELTNTTLLSDTYVTTPLGNSLTIASVMGEGHTGSRWLTVSNGGLTTWQAADLKVIGVNFPWVRHCHLNSNVGSACDASATSLANTLLLPATNYTIFLDGVNTHWVQGQTMIEFAWQGRNAGDPDVTVQAMPSGGTKYALTTCLAGATNAGDNTLGNVCVVDQSFQCDGISPGQCAKVMFQIAQNATDATCTAAYNTWPQTSSPACYNGGMHSFLIDTVPATAPARCYGAATTTTDGSDCGSVWQSGGPWAAGTERAMSLSGVQVAFDSTQTPLASITGCTDTTTSTPCILSPVDGLPLFPMNGHGVSLSMTGYHTEWDSTYQMLAVFNPVLTVTSPTTATATATVAASPSGAVVQWSAWAVYGTKNLFSTYPKFQNPTSTWAQTLRAGFQYLSTNSATPFGIDFCSEPVGDGSSVGNVRTVSKYSRATSNQVNHGQSFTVRCYFYLGSSAFTLTGLGCATGPCPSSSTGKGLDFGADIAIDSVTVVNPTTLDIVGFVCDGVTSHPGCTPQVGADVGAIGTQFRHMYMHGGGRVLHTGLGTDPGPAQTPCLGSIDANPGWICHMSNGMAIGQALYLEGTDSAVEDSYLDNIWYNNAGVIQYESHGTIMVGGTGPIKIVNNFINAAGENVFTGGGGSTFFEADAIDNSDMDIERNYLLHAPWWYNAGIGIIAPTVTGSPYAVDALSEKNQRELKTGQRVLYAGNIADSQWEGLVQTYASWNMTPRIVGGVKVGSAICCMTLADIYSHDNLILNVHEANYFYGLDTFCNMLSDQICQYGLFPSTQLTRLLVFNDLALANKNESSPQGHYNTTGQFPYFASNAYGIYYDISHVTYTMQGAMTTNHAVGWQYVSPSDVVGPTGASSQCPNGTTIGPFQRYNVGVTLHNNVFYNSFSDAGGCAFSNSFSFPSSPAANDINHRVAGNVWGTWGQFQAVSGINTNVSTYSKINYVADVTNHGGTSTWPAPLVTFKQTVAQNYLLDASVGFAGDYTMTGNNVNTTSVPGQVLGGWIGPSASNTTDGLTAGIIMSRLLAAIATTATGSVGAVKPTGVITPHIGPSGLRSVQRPKKKP